MQCSSTKLSAICESATYRCQIMKHELLNCSVCRIYAIVGENISSLCDRFSTRQKKYRSLGRKDHQTEEVVFHRFSSSSFVLTELDDFISIRFAV